MNSYDHQRGPVQHLNLAERVSTGDRPGVGSMNKCTGNGARGSKCRLSQEFQNASEAEETVRHVEVDKGLGENSSVKGARVEGEESSKIPKVFCSIWERQKCHSEFKEVGSSLEGMGCSD